MCSPISLVSLPLGSIRRQLRVNSLAHERVVSSRTDAVWPLTGVAFPKNFRDTVKTIVRRLFRVYAHIYSNHFDHVCALGIEGASFSVSLLTSALELWSLRERLRTFTFMNDARSFILVRCTGPPAMYLHARDAESSLITGFDCANLALWVMA